MADGVRFYLDQNVHHIVADALRRVGIDVLTAYEAGSCGWDDPDQLAYAAVNCRVIVTFDRDFLVLHASGAAHAGIAWTPSTKYSIGELAGMLEILHGVYTAAEMQDRLEYL